MTRGSNPQSLSYTSEVQMEEDTMTFEGKKRPLGRVNINFNVIDRDLLKTQYINTFETIIIGSPVLYITGSDLTQYTIPLHIPVIYRVLAPYTVSPYILWNANVPETFDLLTGRPRVPTKKSVYDFLSGSNALEIIDGIKEENQELYFIIEHGALSRNVLVLKGFENLNELTTSINMDMVALVTSIWNQIKAVALSNRMDAKVKLSSTLIDTFPSNGLSSVLGKLSKYTLYEYENEMPSTIFDESESNLRSIANYVYWRLSYITPIPKMKYAKIRNKNDLFLEKETIHKRAEIIRTLVSFIKMGELVKYIKGMLNNVNKVVTQHDIQSVMSMRELTFAYVNIYYESESLATFNMDLGSINNLGDAKAMCLKYANTLVQNFNDISAIIKKI